MPLILLAACMDVYVYLTGVFWSFGRLLLRFTFGFVKPLTA